MEVECTHSKIARSTLNFCARYLIN